MFGYTDFSSRQSVQVKKMKECIWINNFEGENMKMFERREMQLVWLGYVGNFHSTCCEGSHRHLGIP